MTMAAVGVDLLLYKGITSFIKTNAMTEILSFIIVGVVTFMGRPASASAMISHQTRPLAQD